MRVLEWEEVNNHALLSVDRVNDGVDLVYGIEDGRLIQDLKSLVEAEGDCCGAAGVKFELVEREDSVCVSVAVLREGLPSRTVIDAFATMVPR